MVLIKTMNYKATFNVPAKYLGSEVTSLMAKMSTEDVSKLIVPVTATIGGNFSKPTVSTDYKASVTNLTKQLVDVNKLKGKGTEILTGLIKVPTAKDTDSVKNTSTPKVDITKPKEAVDNLVKNKLNSLLSGKKKAKDTVN